MMTALSRSCCAIACVLASLGPILGRQPVEGTWLVEDRSARIEIVPCEQRLCGRIVWLQKSRDDSGREPLDTKNPNPARRQQTILGLELLRGVQASPDRKGVWRGGTIYDPQTGKSYSCQLSLVDPDHLKLRGYIGLSLIGRSTRWTRVAAGEALAERPEAPASGRRSAP